MACPSFVNPEYWKLLGSKAPTVILPPATDLNAIRKAANDGTKAAYEKLPLPPGMTITTSTATSADGTEFTITRFVPRSVQQQQSNQTAPPPQRAIVFAFGGGLVAGSVALCRPMIADLAERTATQVFAPDYRLAPEDPYPAALEDVYATLTWLQARAGELGVDPARIVTLGQSAGGNLTVAAALLARDRGLAPPIAGQVLRYPMLDDRTRIDPQSPRFPYLTWRPSVNALAWSAYLSRFNDRYDEKSGMLMVPDTAAPARAQDLRGLPPTQIGVGSLDLFHDEAVDFAARLASHGVPVQSTVYPGVPHGFDASPAFSLRAELWDDETRFIQQF